MFNHGSLGSLQFLSVTVDLSLLLTVLLINSRTVITKGEADGNSLIIY